jgi:hypothetical protein
MGTSLKDILVADAAKAKASQGGYEEIILTPGKYTAKVLGFTEEETYQYMSLQINGRKHNFFYNYYNYGTQDLNKQLIDWIQSLATIPVTPKTSLLEIVNSAIGSSYNIDIYNYVSKSGKNEGKTQHAINFKVSPELETVIIETETLEDLPF